MNYAQMTAVEISALLISAVLIFSLPRRFVLITILAAGIFIPHSPRIQVFGFGFTAIRFLLLFGWIRLIFKSEFHSIKKFNDIDKILCIFVFVSSIAYILVYQEAKAFTYRMNIAYYILGTYFLFRFYIIDLDDIERIIKCLLYISIVIAFFVVIEKISGRNNLFIFFGAPYEPIIREGKLRCFGSFSHPITLGSFAAFISPLAFYMLWKEKGSKKLGLVSLISSVVIVVCTGSSGPFISLIASAVGLIMWLFRKHMRIVQWGLLFTTIGLHLVMKAPVWALIQRVNVFGGSSSFHRFLLVDEFIRSFSEWWLIGVKVVIDLEADVPLWDTSNQYVLIGKDGGLMSLVLFIIIIALCFRHVGRMVFLANDDENHQKLFWALGVGMFSYVVSFMGVSLWDQTTMVWYFLVATIASITYNNFGELQKQK